MRFRYTAAIGVIAWPSVPVVALLGATAGILWVIFAAAIVAWRVSL